LSIEYSFKGEVHRAEVGDTQAVVAPLRGELYHLILSFALHFAYGDLSISIQSNGRMRDSRFLCSRILNSFFNILIFPLYLRFLKFPASASCRDPKFAADDEGEGGTLFLPGPPRSGSSPHTR
jgi:hypothetical protein